MTASAVSRLGEATLQESLGPLASVFHRQVAAAGVTTDQAGVVAIAGALLMRATIEGHICLTPEEIAEHAGVAGVPLAAEALRRELGNHPWVGNGDGATPLVFEQDRLYLRRFREAEVRLACAIRDRVAAPPLPIDPSLAPRFREIFPSIDAVDWQAVAATAGLRSRFSLITGGREQERRRLLPDSWRYWSSRRRTSESHLPHRRARLLPDSVKQFGRRGIRWESTPASATHSHPLDRPCTASWDTGRRMIRSGTIKAIRSSTML